MSFRGQLRRLGIDTDGKDVEIFDGDLTLKSTHKLFFRDSGVYIYSNADGYLTIEADTGIIIAADVALTGSPSFEGGLAVTGDLTAAHGLSVTMDAPMLAIGNLHVSGIHADITQTSAVAGTGTAEGRLYGIRSIVRQELDITNVFGVHALVVATPAAAVNVNDFVGVYGAISAQGTFANTNSGLSSWAALKGEIWNDCSGSWDAQVYCLMLGFASRIDYTLETALIHAYSHGSAYLDYGIHLISNSTIQAMTSGIYVESATGSTITNGLDIDGAGTITTGIDVGSCTTAMAVTGTVAKGIDCTDATMTQGWNNGFFVCGSGNGSAGDQHSMAVTDHYIPIQVNIASTAGPATPKEVCAAMLRVDAITAGQNNSSVDVLCLRSDLSQTVFAASGINASTNISADMTVGAGSLHGIYCSITGSKTITCGSLVTVFEARYAQTSGGGGVDSVATISNIAPSCSVTSILDIHNWSGTATNGILIQGAATMTTGLSITHACVDAIVISGACTGNAIEIIGACNSGNKILITDSTATTGQTSVYLNQTITPNNGNHVGAHFKVTWTPGTPASGTNVGGNAIRGEFIVDGRVNATSWLSAVSARLKFDADADYTAGGSILTALQGQLEGDGSATITAGNIAVCQLHNASGEDLSATEGISTYLWFSGTGATNKMNSAMYCSIGSSTYFIEWPVVADTMISEGAYNIHGGAIYRIACKIGPLDVYLLASTAPTSHS